MDSSSAIIHDLLQNKEKVEQIDEKNVCKSPSLLSSLNDESDEASESDYSEESRQTSSGIEDRSNQPVPSSCSERDASGELFLLMGSYYEIFEEILI